MKHKIVMVIKETGLTGALVHYLGLANALAKRGHKVCFLLITDDNVTVDYFQKNSSRHMERIVVKKPFLFHFIRNVISIRRRFDVIHCDLSTAHFGLTLGKLLRKPLAVTIHHLDQRRTYGFEGWIRYSLTQVKAKGVLKGFLSFIMRFSLSLPSWPLIFVPSSATATRVRQWIPRAKRIVVVWNGVDIDLIDSMSVQRKKRQVISMQKLFPEKYVEHQIKAIENIPGLRLKVVGVGPLKEKLLKIAGEKADFLGYVPEREKVKLMKESLALIHTSSIEGFCLSIAEALACRLPVVAYDLPALREVFGDTVHYVPLRDVKKLTETLRTVIKLRPVNEKGRNLVKNKYTWDNVAKIEEEALSKWL